MRVVYFAKITGWEVAGKTRLCCVGRNWRRAWWGAEKGGKSAKDEEVYLRVDGAREWRLIFYHFLGKKGKESERGNSCA